MPQEQNSTFRYLQQNRVETQSFHQKRRRVDIHATGVWISFLKHSPNWRVDQNFYSPRQKTTGQKYRNGQ
jgi:hypothetical protein